MAFHALIVAQQIIPAIKPLLDRVRTRDADLARQAARAVASVPLNIAEGRRRAGGDQRHLFRVALGSAAEVSAALDVAVGWGYLDRAAVAHVESLLDRVRAMLWNATR